MSEETLSPLYFDKDDLVRAKRLLKEAFDFIGEQGTYCSGGIDCKCLYRKIGNFLGVE